MAARVSPLVLVFNRPSASPFTLDAFFPNLGLWVVRGRDETGSLWELAAKGGHNDEHHNHNDVGSFILNIDGVPMLTEIGAREYVKDFSRRKSATASSPPAALGIRCR